MHVLRCTGIGKYHLPRQYHPMNLENFKAGNGKIQIDKDRGSVMRLTQIQ